MNIWDFLAQAGFFTWVGLFVLTAIISLGVASIGPLVISRDTHENSPKGKDAP